MVNVCYVIINGINPQIFLAAAEFYSRLFELYSFIE